MSLLYDTDHTHYCKNLTDTLACTSLIAGPRQMRSLISECMNLFHLPQLTVMPLYYHRCHRPQTSSDITPFAAPSLWDFYTAISNHLCQSCFCAGYCADCCAVCRFLCNLLTEENIRSQKLISWHFIFTLLNSLWWLLTMLSLPFNFMPFQPSFRNRNSFRAAWGCLVLLQKRNGIFK